MIPTITYSAPAVTVVHAQSVRTLSPAESGHGVTVTANPAPGFSATPPTEGACAISDSQALYLHRLAVRLARRVGLDEDQAEDCAGQFVVGMLTPPRLRQLQAAFAQGSIGWLFRCAENWAVNYLRQIRTLGVREVSWFALQPSEAGEDRVGHRHPAWETASSEGNPEAELLRSELNTRILAAFTLLRHGRAALFLPGLFACEHPSALKSNQSSTPGAIRQARWRLRRRLRQLLTNAGMTAEEAHSYLELLSRL